MLWLWLGWRNRRSPALITLVGLFLILCAVIWFSDRNHVICNDHRIDPGDVCSTYDGNGMPVTRTYQQLKDQHDLWVPIAAPAAAVLGLCLVSMGIASSWSQGTLYRGQKRPGPDLHDYYLEDSPYAQAVTHQLAQPPPPPPPSAPSSWRPPAPSGPPPLHHDA